MVPKWQVLSVILTTWMMAAVSCAALPFLHAVPTLKAADRLAPMLLALAIGAAVGVLLSVAARRLADIESSPKVSWRSFTPGQASALGIICWGIPVGLIFSVDEYLQTSNLFVVIPSLVIWPLGGIVFGLLMRWFVRRGGRTAQDS